MKPLIGKLLASLLLLVWPCRAVMIVTPRMPQMTMQNASAGEALNAIAEGATVNGHELTLILKKVRKPPGAQQGERRQTIEFPEGRVLDALQMVAKLYHCALRIDSRGVMLIEVPENQPMPERVPRPTMTVAAGEKTQKLREALTQCELNRVEFRDATVRETGEYLVQRYRAESGDRRPLPFVLKVKDEDTLPRVTLTACDLPPIEALRYVAELSGLDMTVAASSITLSSP